jgi:ankyrin repeat protein
MHQSLRRDNSLSAIELLLDHDGDPTLRSNYDGRSAIETAARRGRADALRVEPQ